MSAYGPGIPPRNPAAEAKRVQAELQRHQRQLLLRQHVEASAVGLLELARIVGAVLLVLDLHGLTPVPMLASLALAFAPNLASLASLAWVVYRARLARRRNDR
ncbi:putative membrane protein [Stenotrophomonas phage Suso]|nr:putative membrane protein [Stenotrophomonas phage Suso]